MSAKRQERVFAIAVGIIAALCALSLLHVVQVVPLQVPLDPNEGWNAYHAQAAMEGRALYPPSQSMMINNYPPLFFYLDGALGRVVGDYIIAGRILSLTALAAIAVEIVLAVRRMGAAASEAAFAALLFVAALLLQSDYVGMSDPQLIGQSFQLPALIILLKSPRSTRAIALAALLSVLGFFFKHNLVVLPIALALWLVLIDRRAGIKLALFGLGFLVAGLIAFRLSLGVDLLEQLQSARVYSFGLLLSGFGPWLAWNGVPLVAAFAALFAARREPFARFCAIYLFIGVAAGAAFYGGAGVDINAMFDAFIALSLTAGLALARWRERLPRLLVAGAWMGPLAIGVIASFNGNWLAADYWLNPMQHERQSASADIEFLRRQPGPAVCEMLSLCYWAGKTAEIDVFNLGQQFATGKRSDDALVDLIARKHFAAIQVDPDGSFALTPHVGAVFDANYTLDHSNEDDGAFYLLR